MSKTKQFRVKLADGTVIGVKAEWFTIGAESTLIFWEHDAASHSARIRQAFAPHTWVRVA